MICRFEKEVPKDIACNAESAQAAISWLMEKNDEGQTRWERMGRWTEGEENHFFSELSHALASATGEVTNVFRSPIVYFPCECDPLHHLVCDQFSAPDPYPQKS